MADCGNGSCAELGLPTSRRTRGDPAHRRIHAVCRSAPQQSATRFGCYEVRILGNILRPWRLFVLPERPDALVGTMLGKDYRVLAPIGIGGMAVVYLVEHQTLLKQFAAKVLSHDLASSLEARARFTQEAHAASQLDHENIVSISDFGVTADHRPFFVMELLRGQTLDQRLAEGPMTIEEVVAVGVPVARALAHAHAEGIVHLDVKPENIFLVQRSQGRWGVKVVDFGIAKTPLSPRVAKAGETVGSPMFMAPEMCRGADDVDQRADVYSFGILLYLMLCGRLPFDDDSLVRVLQMQLVELPRPPRELNSQLSPELAAIVERALAKHPDDRYPSMAALLRDLDAALPDGADRLLIEAQSGTALGETPFSGAMSIGGAASIGRHASHRMPRAATPAPASGVLASQPPARRAAHHRRLAIALPSVVVVVVLFGITAWRQTSAGGRVPAGAAETAAPAYAGAPGAVDALAGAKPEVQVAPAAVAPASEPPAAAAPSDDSAAPVDVANAPGAEPQIEVAAADDAKGDRPGVSAKKLRAKPAVRRPVKRTVAISSAAGRGAATGAGPTLLPVGAPAVVATVAIEAPTVTAIAAPTADAIRAGSAAGREAAVAAPPAAAALPAPAAPVAPTIKAAPAAPAVSAPGSLDAVPTVTTLDVKGSLSPSIVRRSVDRTLDQLRACYRVAAHAGGSTPAVDLQLSFEIDENGLATRVATAGTRFGSLASCAAGVTGQIRTQEAPDVGTAHVTVGIRFRPS